MLFFFFNMHSIKDYVHKHTQQQRDDDLNVLYLTHLMEDK